MSGRIFDPVAQLLQSGCRLPRFFCQAEDGIRDVTVTGVQTCALPISFEEAKLESIIETRGITDVLFKKREPRAHGEARAEFGGFGTKPAAVRDDGIDLTVVGNVAKRLREMPGRLRVRGIALVKDSKSGCERRIAQIFVELRKLPGREQALIHDGLRRKRADVTARGQERFRAFS